MTRAGCATTRSRSGWKPPCTPGPGPTWTRYWRICPATAGRTLRPAALRSRWQRGWAALVSRLPRAWPSASWPVLMFPSGEQSRFTIGRDSGCDMVLPDPTVSRWHAGLRREPGGWLLDDLGSTNGTLLNGWRVRAWVPVRDGDLVSFGAVTFVVGTPGSGRRLTQTP